MTIESVQPGANLKWLHFENVIVCILLQNFTFTGYENALCTTGAFSFAIECVVVACENLNIDGNFVFWITTFIIIQAAAGWAKVTAVIGVCSISPDNKGSFRVTVPTVSPVATVAPVATPGSSVVLFEFDSLFTRESATLRFERF